MKHQILFTTHAYKSCELEKGFQQVARDWNYTKGP